MAVAQRSIWSFARFVLKDIVKGIIDSSISTELGGVRQEVTILSREKDGAGRNSAIRGRFSLTGIDAVPPAERRRAGQARAKS